MPFSYKNQYPVQIPWRIRLSNGLTRTDPSTFTEEELQDAGWVFVENPPIIVPPKRLGWNGTNWVDRDPNQEEIDAQKRYIQEECKKRLAETDYKTIKAIEAGTAVDPIYVKYRQDLRDLYNNVDVIDIWNVPWPMLDTPDSIEYLE